MTFSIPSVIISCTFRFFPAFCFLLGDSSVIIKSILYDSVSKNSLRNRHTVKPSVNTDTKATCPYCTRNGKPWLIYCKMLYKFKFFFLIIAYNQPCKETCSTEALEGEQGRFNSCKRVNSAM